MPTIAELLKKAAESSPPQKQLESKGHSVQSAVDWIIAEEGIEASSRNNRSLRQLFARQKPKS